MMVLVKRILWSIACAIVLSHMGSCSMIDEEEYRVDYINYRYLDSTGFNDIDQIEKMTDFIFTKDSILYRVDNDIQDAEKRRRRPLNLPDGEWNIVTYGNLDKNTRLDYIVGETRLANMLVQVARSTSHSAGDAGTPDGSFFIGDADKLYFGKLHLIVKDGFTDQIHQVDMSNVHIWINGIIHWKKDAPVDIDNLNIRLEYVPVESNFLSEDLYDERYKIGYSVPYLTDRKAKYSTKLKQSYYSSGLEFSICSLRWTTERVPVLRIYDGDTPIVGNDISLNEYFTNNGVKLTHARVQRYNIEIIIDGSTVNISNQIFDGWEDGGNIN